MKLETKFDMNQDVALLKFNCHPATIVEILFTGNNLLYKVEYWWEGVIHTISQNEWELAELKIKELRPIK